MVEWLEQNHQWILILALILIMVGLYQIIKNKREKAKSKSYSSGTSSGIDLIGNGSTSTSQSHYGGGSGGGGGSTRAFLPTNPINHTEASELGKFAGVVVNDPAIAGTTSDELVSDTIQASAVNATDASLDSATITDIAESALEAVGIENNCNVSIIIIKKLYRP